MHGKRRQGYGDNSVAHTPRDGDSTGLPVRQTVIKPAVALFLFSLACVLISWSCALWLLVAISLPLALGSAGLLLSGRGLAGKGWLLPLLSGALVSALWAVHFAATRLDASVPGSDVDVGGYIANLPLTTGDLSRFADGQVAPAPRVRQSGRC